MNASVAIMMGVYNGDKYLREQLDSIERQTHDDWRLIVSDDGSTDDTMSILEDYRKRWGSGRIQLRRGPREGFCTNFLEMACSTDIVADFYAFADQDDVWLPNKLEVALNYLSAQNDQGRVHMYCGRTAYVKNDLKPYELSPLFVYPRTFRNALVQSIAGGNTMVFNRPAKKLIERANITNVVSHDWWLYQLLTGVGGKVYYDDVPYVLYRQHSEALIGGNSSFMAKLKRAVMVVSGRFKIWNDINVNALLSVRHCLNESSLELLELFDQLRRAGSLPQRLRMLEVCGLYRQTWRGTASLILAAALKKL